MTFLEALQNKLFDLHKLKQRKNVWLLNEERIGAAIFDHNTPDAEDILRLADAHEHCHRLLVIAPANSSLEQIMWLHSELVDALIIDEEGVENILQQLDPDLIITGKGSESSLPESFKSKLHQYA